MNARCWCLAALISGAACEVSDADLVPDPIATEAGVIRVVVLADDFVRVGDERMPDAEFILRMRQRFRAAVGDLADRPGLQILAAPDGRRRAAAFAERVLRDLVPLGLRNYELGEDPVE